jgi:glycosyltransferase involved in cell wall biosynthesis
MITMTAPRFSIVITCFNQRNFIAAAVESALAQTHRDKEVIVVDDGSIDGSAEILHNYSDNIRLTAFSANRGAIEARNHGASLARGEYLAFLDGDDLFTPWALDAYEQIIKDIGPKIIFGNAIWFKQDLVPSLKHYSAQHRIEYVDYPTLMAKDREMWLSASVLVVNRQLFHQAGGWSPDIFHMDLYDMATKLGNSGRTACVSAPVTTFYRVHTSNSIQNVEPFVRMALYILKKEKTGQYPQYSSCWFQRQAWFGGMIAFWIKRAARAGFYKGSGVLVLSGWSAVLVAIARRLTVMIKGRRPLSIIDWRHG